MIRAHVNVMLKKDVMDPQGNAVAQALSSLGHKAIKSARVGRCFDLLIDGTDLEAARADVTKMCDELLANVVIERYEIHVEPAAEKK